jgi:peroxiredoxin
MPLPVGSKAPDFTLKSSTPEGLIDVKLSDNFGKKTTVLLFFPAAFTGVCTTEMCGVGKWQFVDPSDSVAVYGISVDTPFAQSAWAKKEGITAPLLSDYARKVTQAYDVVLDNFVGTGGAASARAAFVIDKDGVVRYSEQTPKTTDLPNFEAVRQIVENAG